LDGAAADAGNFAVPPALIFGPDGFASTTAAAAAEVEGLPLAAAFSQHSLIYIHHYYITNKFKGKNSLVVELTITQTEFIT